MTATAGIDESAAATVEDEKKKGTRLDISTQELVKFAFDIPSPEIIDFFELTCRHPFSLSLSLFIRSILLDIFPIFIYFHVYTNDDVSSRSRKIKVSRHRCVLE